MTPVRSGELEGIARNSDFRKVISYAFCSFPGQRGWMGDEAMRFRRREGGRLGQMFPGRVADAARSACQATEFPGRRLR